MKPTEGPSGSDEEPLFLHEDRSPQFEIDPSEDLFEEVAIPDEGTEVGAAYDTWREIPADDLSSRVVPQTVERWADEESRRSGSSSRLALLALIVAVIAAGAASWSGLLGPRATPSTMVTDAERADAARLSTPAAAPTATAAPDVRSAAPNVAPLSPVGRAAVDRQAPVLTPAEREALEASLSTTPQPSAAKGADSASLSAPSPPTPTAAPSPAGAPVSPAVPPSQGVAAVSQALPPAPTAPPVPGATLLPPGYVPYVPAPIIPDPPPAPRPAPPAAAAPAASLPTDESRLRALMDRYRAAFASLDVNQVRSVWPTVDARALSRAFSQIESQQFEFAGCEITVSADRGTAGCSGNAEYVTRIGSKTQRVDAREWTFQFQRVDQDWRIASVVTR